jgi:ribose 5-phosphate isomerase B
VKKVIDALRQDPSNLEGNIPWHGNCYGILLCGTGIGMSIAANRFPFIRAALCHSNLEAHVAREHNDANVLCLGGRVLTSPEARDLIVTFLSSSFKGERHQRRLDKIGAFRE